MNMGDEKLPNKLSALLRIAVADAQKCEASPGYELTMRYWHLPTDAGVCQVCMAGAVMAQSLNFDKSKEIKHGPLSFDHGESLMAIDDMREGDFESAASRIGVAVNARQFAACRAARELVSHDYSPDDGEASYDPFENDPSDYYGKASWATYLEAADILEKAGL